jgi:hypothetical protein
MFGITQSSLYACIFIRLFGLFLSISPPIQAAAQAFIDG